MIDIVRLYDDLFAVTDDQANKFRLAIQKIRARFIAHQAFDLRESSLAIVGAFPKC